MSHFDESPTSIRLHTEGNPFCILRSIGWEALFLTYRIRIGIAVRKEGIIDCITLNFGCPW
jgi:hypothetical protein